MSSRVPWEAAFAVGHELIDAQHQRLLAQCNLLADHCDAGEAGHAAFDEAFQALRTMVREHFEAESALLASRNHPDLEGLRDEFDEFGYVADEVATTTYFDRDELQLFVARWCLGHVASARAQYAGDLG